MLGILIKKQFAELYRNFFYDQKKNKARSKAASIVSIILYAVLMIGVLGGMFTVMSVLLCDSLVSMGMGWFFFALTATVAIAIGIFGSVFSTYSSLYLAKDNDLLLSLPVPVKYILASRLICVYLFGLMFSGAVLIPAVIVYNIFAGVTVMSVIGGLMFILNISGIVFILSCLLGWVVAKASLKLKNKSFATVALSIIFVAAYYFVYYKAGEAMEGIIANAEAIGEKIKGFAYPIYAIGRSGEGDILSILGFTAVTAALLALVLYVIAKSFIKIATSSGAASKAKYVEKTAKKNSIFGAMLGKEFSRFTSSPNYMLNCGFGILGFLVLTVVIFMKGDVVVSVISSLLGEETTERLIPVILCTGAATLMSMNDTAVPSVSLEGKSVWIAQSLPIDPWTALKAKLGVQILITVFPAAIFTASFFIKIKTDLLSAVLSVVFIAVYIVFFALLCLFIGLKKANLNWTSEIYPIKQNSGVLIVLLIDWAFALVFGLFYLLAGCHIMSAAVYLIIWTVIISILSVIIYEYLKTKGAKAFAAL